MGPGPRLPHVVFMLAVCAGALAVSRRRLGEAQARIAGLEAQAVRLGDEGRKAFRVRDDFLATLSHELRTPLNALLGWVQLLRLHHEDAAMRLHAIDVIERNARAQVQLVADLLDVSRIITGRMRLALVPLDLATVVRAGCDALVATAAAKDVVLRMRLKPLEGTVYGDAARLRQVVWNLVSNGIKFTPAGGRVTVTLHSCGHCAEISVTDSGAGIAPEVLPYLFAHFHQGDSSLTRRYGGLGLGLAIVRHLVELHGGTVHAASEGLNRGAAFSARFPMRAAVDA